MCEVVFVRWAGVRVAWGGLRWVCVRAGVLAGGLWFGLALCRLRLRVARFLDPALQRALGAEASRRPSAALPFCVLLSRWALIPFTLKKKRPVTHF